MKNISSGDAEIIWTIKEDSILVSPFYINSSEELKIKLDNKKPYNRVDMSFGIDNWTPAKITDVVDDLESMEIRWKDGVLKLDSEEEIGKYLIARRRGISRSKIWIVIKDKTSE